jgi:hypothetical protein
MATTNSTTYDYVQIDDGNDIRTYHLADLGYYMDEDIREDIHLRLAPCAPQEFWDAYAAADPHWDEVVAMVAEAEVIA